MPIFLLQVPNMTFIIIGVLPAILFGFKPTGSLNNRNYLMVIWFCGYILLASG